MNPSSIIETLGESLNLLSFRYFIYKKGVDTLQTEREWGGHHGPPLPLPPKPCPPQKVNPSTSYQTIFHKQAHTHCTYTKQLQEFWWIIEFTEGFILRQRNRLHCIPQSQFSLSKKSHCFVIHGSFPRSPLHPPWSSPSWPTSGKISPVLVLYQPGGRKPAFLGVSEYSI